jgi:hypothetical protein
MKVGMIQSNFIPWRGYFDFIDDVELFVFYDDVKYTPRDWRNRNRIKTRDGAVWASVPVIHDSGTLIQDARIDYSNRWVEKHVRTISIAYAKASYFGAYANQYFAILQQQLPTISDLNIALCKWIMSSLGISTQTVRSREFGISGDREHRPLLILEALKCTCYLSGPAARPYTNAEAFRLRGIGLEYKQYEYPEYPQLHSPFVSDVTVLDLLFNCGPEARKYLKSTKPNELVVPPRSNR